MGDANPVCGPSADSPPAQGFGFPWPLKAGKEPKRVEQTVAARAEGLPRGGSPVTVCGDENAPPAATKLTPQQALEVRENENPAKYITLRHGNMVARVYVQRKTGGARSDFAVLKENEAFMTGLLPRIFWSIDIAYIVATLEVTDIIVTAENVEDGGENDFGRECLLRAEKGEKTPSRPAVGGTTESGVCAMACVRFFKASELALRRATRLEMKKVLGHLERGYAETVAATQRMGVYNTPGGAGHARLVAYVASQPVLRARISELQHALDDENSPTSKALPKADFAVNGRGRLTSVVVANTELKPDDWVMYLAAISCAGGSRGAGGVVLRRVCALADAFGAFIIINAVPLDGLCTTFYADAGFQFVRYAPLFSDKPADYLCPMMMRAPDTTRRSRAAALPRPGMREWGTDITRRFQPSPALPSLGPFADFIHAWDAEYEYQARGLSLMAQDGVEDAVHTPRAPVAFRHLPEWGLKETRDEVSDDDARRLCLRMGAVAAVQVAAVQVDTDDEDVVEVVEEDCGARPVPANWQAVAPSEAGKRRREDAVEEEPPAQRSRRDVILEEAAVAAAEPRALRIRTSSSVVAVAPTPSSQRQEYDSHLLVNLLVAFAANAELVEKALTRLLAQMRGPLSAADLGIVAGVATRHADSAAVIRLAGSVALACLME